MCNISYKIYGTEIFARLKKLGVGDKDMRELEKLMSKNHDKLSAELSEEQKDILQRYYDRINEYIGLSCEHAFSSGFSMGVKLVAAAMSK